METGKHQIRGIVCGSMDMKISPSWGKTTEVIYDALSKQADIVAFIDYSIKDRYLQFFHKQLTKLQYSNVTHRDWFENIITERNFIKEYSQKDLKPDFFMHISYMTVPKALINEGLHFNYCDATIFGSVKYDNKVYSKRYLTQFVHNTKKYSDRLKGIFTFNQWTKDSLVNDFKIAENKIFNVGFGANLNPYFGEKDYSNNLILTVLRRGTEHKKGLFLLLDAFELARSSNKKLRLAVVGTTNRKIDGVEYFEGYPREKTIELFREASLFAMPALFEPNGMVYPEALASRTPILGLDRCAFPEFSGYGKYGFIVKAEAEDIAKKILFAFENPSLLKEKATEGQKFILGRYDWKVVVHEMLKKIE